MAEFELSSKKFKAKRMSQPFSTKVDGMKLTGYGMDWCVTREDGQSFPLPDHIFKMLFEPLDDEAKHLFTAKYLCKLEINESLSLKDRMLHTLGVPKQF